MSLIPQPPAPTLLPTAAQAGAVGPRGDLGTPNPADLLPTDMPEPIRRLMSDTVPFQPQMEHELYRQKRELWELYLKLYELEQDDLRGLVQKHSESDDPKTGEDPKKFEARKKLATCYNLIPIIVRMTVSYIFTESPTIDVGGDADLEAFIANCDGNGTPLDHFVKQTVLPMAQVLGWVDVLVQNPLVSRDLVKTAADRQANKVMPTVYPIFPQQRINWSTRTNHEYNWVCFRENSGDDNNPFRRNSIPLESYITLSASMDGVDGLDENGFWIRSWMPFRDVASGTPPKPVHPTPPGAVGEAEFQHVADFCPTARVPVATIYWQRSCDPKRRHFGISKLAAMAPLEVAIIQLLSWLMEDIRANLSILGLPTQDGRYPQNEDGSPVDISMNPSTVVTYRHDASHPPHRIEGDVKHIEAKIKVIEGHIREILRLGNLLGASAEAEKISSGVQGVVMRNELFRELKDGADSCDTFTMELLAIAKSWLTGEDWTADRLKNEGKVSVRYFKGPYATEPLEAVIGAASAAIELLREVSPTACQKAFEEAARSMIPADDPDLATALAEIADNTGAVLEQQTMQDALANANTAAMQDETTLRNELRTEKTSPESNAE